MISRRLFLPCLLLMMIITFAISTLTLLSHVATSMKSRDAISHLLRTEAKLPPRSQVVVVVPEVGDISSSPFSVGVDSSDVDIILEKKKAAQETFLLRGVTLQQQQKESASAVMIPLHSSLGKIGTVEFLKYWTRPPEPFSGLVSDVEENNKVFVPPVLDKDRRYITFEDDTGGFNNIRMAFEVFVAVAKITGRILVLPPPCRFYLLDRGPIAIFKNQRETYSTYSDYFDMDHLVKEGGIKVISTREFLNREAKNLGIPEKIVRETNVTYVDISNGHHTDYFMWLRKSDHGIIFPSGPNASPNTPFALDDVRLLKQRGPGAIQPDRVFIHFPMHSSLGLRYLSGIERLLATSDKALHVPVRLFIRNYVHFCEDPVVIAAAKAIDKLGGPGAYSALHIRRNELQYKEVFKSASESLKNVKSLLLPGETLYLATDETAPGFFRAFREAGYKVLLLGDILPGIPSLNSAYALDLKNGTSDPALLRDGAKIGGVGHEIRGDGAGGLDVGAKHRIFVKHIGLVEQLIAASGRMFIGTSSSTFTSYIQRIRGNLGRGDLSCYYHDVFIKSGNPLDRPPPNCKGLMGNDADLWRLREFVDAKTH